MLGSDGQQCCVRLHGAVEKVTKKKSCKNQPERYLRWRLGVNIQLPVLLADISKSFNATIYMTSSKISFFFSSISFFFSSLAAYGTLFLQFLVCAFFKKIFTSRKMRVTENCIFKSSKDTVRIVCINSMGVRSTQFQRTESRRLHSHGEYSPSLDNMQRRVSSQLGDSNTTRDDYQRETENGRKLAVCRKNLVWCLTSLIT